MASSWSETAAQDPPPGHVVGHIDGIRFEGDQFMNARLIWYLPGLANEPVQDRITEELNAEVLFNDRYSLVVGQKSKWARRRSVELSDLLDEPWIMTPLDALGDRLPSRPAQK
jgi:hypothetical protein